jgi:copper oxidase (laccase) domain-containing protein
MTASLREATDFERPIIMTPVQRPSPLQSPALGELAGSGIRHGFFTRIGGVSEGIYRGLNTGTGSDDEPRIRENRRRVAEWMGVGPDIS